MRNTVLKGKAVYYTEDLKDFKWDIAAELCSDFSLAQTLLAVYKQCLTLSNRRRGLAVKPISSKSLFSVPQAAQEHPADSLKGEENLTVKN